ncbi:2-hydroxyacid dehydrogenase [Sediminispirochaeta bajacaliforniensis]|uniref:2-hydroxyacid dehydrogenase n=1 Tax=Sediminispirochaeta bajacaliforniensis TaxID=148 RepID=UPI00037CF5E8|nr:D-glycerate dehydrogenase [Sediminispirochaeta bajacaliforniensis]
MKKVYVSRAISDKGIELLRRQCDVRVQAADRPATREELLEGADWADGLLSLLCDKIDEEVLSAGGGLKAVANYAVGYDNIDLTAAGRLGVGVSNTPDVLTHATAEMAWALLFAVARQVVPSDRLMRSGRWQGWAPMEFVGCDVTGKTLGIIGAGRIGTAMGLMSSGFGMKVIYWNRSASPRLEEGVGAQRVELDQLIEESDFISLHLPLNNTSRHLIGRPQFEAMKPTSCLINTGRGALIDEAALVDALRKGKIAGAGLDVYEFEPAMSKGLADLDNVVITTHTGSATSGSRGDMAVMAAENLIAMLDGRAGAQCLNAEVFHHR